MMSDPRDITFKSPDQGRPDCGQLTEGMLGYLLALVRRDLRKHATSIERFERRDGQDQAEADEALAQMQRQQRFRRSVFDAVERVRRSL